MDKKLFSDTENEIHDAYITEASADRKLKPLHSGWWKRHKPAACFSAVFLIAALSFGTVFAVNANFRQAVIPLHFPDYTKHQLHEVDEGHRTGAFSMEDTLFTFLEKFNREHMADTITVKKADGFNYVILPDTENSVNVIAECTSPDNKLLVVMEKSDYKETTGLWQVIAYQILDSRTANEMLENK